jgi:hypothetical protein
LLLDCLSGSLLNTQGLGAQLAAAPNPRALLTETKVESGMSQSKSGTSVNLSNSGKRLPMGAFASLHFNVNSPHQTGSTVEGVGFNWGCGSRKGGVDHLQGWGLGVDNR